MFSIECESENKDTNVCNMCNPNVHNLLFTYKVSITLTSQLLSIIDMFSLGLLKCSNLIRLSSQTDT